MTASGDLRDRLQFEKRIASADDYGNPGAGEFTPQFIRRAEIVPLRGGEEVIAARLQGTQPIRIRIRYDSETASITPEWRAVDVSSGQAYAIKTVVAPDRRNAWIEILAEAGVAA